MEKYKILVIAELNSLGGIISGLLSKEGIEVTVVEAWDRVEKIYAELSRNNYDMVLPTNNSLTPGKILELIPEIKKKYPGIKIIVLSGCNTPKFMEELKDLDIDEFFPLPFPPVNLIQRVEAILTSPLTK